MNYQKIKRFSDEELDKMYYLLVNGIQIDVIANYFNCNKNTIYRYKKKFNLTNDIIN